MGDERVGRQRQNLVEDEQGQQVLGEGDADGGRNGHGEEEIETGKQLLKRGDGLK